MNVIKENSLPLIGVYATMIQGQEVIVKRYQKPKYCERYDRYSCVSTESVGFDGLTLDYEVEYYK